MRQCAGIRRAICAGLALIWLLMMPLWAACAETEGVPDYALAESWAYFADGEGPVSYTHLTLPTT